MFVTGDTLVHSAGDLALASRCEYALLRTLDANLGRIETEQVDDAMFARLARLGSRHEARELLRLEREHPDGVVTIERPAESIPSALAAAAQATLAAAQQRVPVIYQGTFFDGEFLGFSDFLIHDPSTDTYAVHDTKLSRTERVPSVLQIAAYADALEAVGVPTSATGHLVLGDGTDHLVHLPDVLPVYRRARSEMVALLSGHLTQLLPASWADPDIRACFRCEHCTPEVEAQRDLLLVAGMRVSQRSTLHAAGITTVDELATHTGPVADLSERSLGTLRAQALAQVQQEQSGSPVVDVHTPSALGALPAPDEGDIFFDFEGDPLYAERGSSDWGLEYLFGVMESDGAFRPFWAHDRHEERAAFVAFVEYVRARREAFPGMHVYHYAAYEKSALLRLASRYGVYENEVDDLLRQQILVDLYPVVRSALRIGAPSYSIKKLEPLYMTDHRGDVADAVASITEYARWCDLRDRGDLDEAAGVLAEIADYNEYDCRSTRELRDWLLGHAERAGVVPRGPLDAAEPVDEDRDAVRDALWEFAGEPVSRTADQQAIALLAAAVGYHQREEKPYWWAHFDRLASPVDEWADTRDVFMVEEVESMTEWATRPRAHVARRTTVLRGEFGPGSGRVGTEVRVLYAPPAPEWVPPRERANPQYRWTMPGRIVDVSEDGAYLTVEEALTKEAEPHDVLPVATVPKASFSTTTLREAIAATAAEAADHLPEVHASAVVDLLRRDPPRTRSGAPLATVVDEEIAAAITASLLDLDDSYIAVQGPPGTGKTYTGSRVIAALARDHGWRIGVVGQSHSVIENLLDNVVEAGLDPAAVVKVKATSGPHPWVDVKAWGDHSAAHTGGCVVGATAWPFTNRKEFAEQELDLLVVDEAGQFSLANTIAVARVARNLLLLGDPQQLPQVSQGSHPEPVDTSALGWLADGSDTLPADLGYFLATTRRMHPELCSVVSELSYDGRLRSHDTVLGRHLDGVDPGVHTVLVDHEGNATSSREEAVEIVRLARSLVGSAWTCDGETRPLGASDLLVVAAYNAQVATVRAALDDAGLHEASCGTVDKFQGREAAVVIVSMAASAPEDVPRGMQFLLSRNRINVALSRGQWAAYVVRSPALTHYLPSTPAELSLVGAFMRVSPDE
ncbi:TM0106 family RecB-like putative nuclease [Rhodococcus sp. BP-349]|uniref:TM0106 family RecB-like putative nuclease n=1 Tax=unclassified Rhodococcus (in: high G+C Gram-positive bacteria) TaxID=192944 RepID=UPI001C9ACAD6|nr:MULTISPECIES: bifunctional RecB family nuclease/DEAD/DEAH box helicase [unclassified Rhodococcus (in: high G+C Gram-positive bacteria)]MBY6539889.1 TM0106 family RecB-like putative nuclease [Rhodococcus sp. BP-363]MBY6543783.1 TM0106 family RecB-like putative nuclease [Rhodococcus sp. BP-369]MBY6563013.1 TM0106 family RecB-like putative nuclease [Rhodococcus sp. BP-370]MBY6577305.1 TM0106 family RecB-like putative nuclease [Rhodococcus sp. BP-364]MBY6586606.1 TM0106 family RecB-like putativ